MPLEWVRKGPGRNLYYMGMNRPKFHSPKTSTLKLTPENNLGKIIRLEDIREKSLSPLNLKEIHLDEPFKDIIKSFQTFACLSSYP